MKVYELGPGWGLEALSCVERPTPTPGPGQVAVAVSAASLNFRDLLMARGHYNPKQPLPLVPLSDGVGRVSALGEGVSCVSVGERVAGIFAQGWLAGGPPADVHATTLGGPLGGMLAETVILNASGVVSVPDYLSDAEAATLPCAGVTAWSALHDDGGLQPGQWVVVQGTGGVSLFALQLAKHAGARVVLTSGSEEKLARARELGADVTLSRHEAWEQGVLEATGGRGADVIVDVGGAQTLQQSLSCVAIGGRIAVIGVLSGIEPSLNLLPILMRRVRVQGIFVGSRAHFVALNGALQASQIKPVVERVYPFVEAVEAFRALEAAQHMGKIVIQVGQGSA